MQTHDTTSTKRSILLLCMPSWVSGLLCVVIALAVVATIVGMVQYNGSTIQKEVIVWRAPTSAESAYEAAFDAEYGSTTFQTDINAFFTALFWSFLALLIYFAIFAVYDVFHTAKTFEEELHYVNASRKNLVREAALRIGVRSGVLAAWFAYSWVFFRTILPYALTAIHIVAGRLLSAQGVAYALVAVVGLVVALHVHVVLFRLLLLRPRVFHGEAYL